MARSRSKQKRNKHFFRVRRKKRMERKKSNRLNKAGQ